MPRAAVYTNAEVQQMILAPKVLDYSLWQTRETDRRNAPESALFKLGVDVDEDAAFWIQTSPTPRIRSFNVSLLARILGRRRQAIVRYDIHDLGHDNPEWAHPAFVGPRVPHQHVYIEKAVELTLHWDSVAEPINAVNDDQVSLFKRFIDDMNIRYDGGSGTDLLGFMNQ